MNKVLIIFMVSLLVGQTSNKETNSQKTGLSVLIQDNQLGISIPHWTSDKSAFVTSFSVLWVEDAGSEYSFGIGVHRYKSNSKVRPYFALNVGAIVLLMNDEDTIIDYFFGPGYGAEYFFDEQLSIGIEAQLNFTKSAEDSGRFGNPGGLNANTATMLFATIYFK